MIIDTLENCARYFSLNKNFEAAFQYLRSADLPSIAIGRHELKGNELTAIINEYETKSEAGEQMESHRKFIDIQYIISGKEKMGIALKKDQQVSLPYSDEKDFLLYADAPEFFIEVNAGSFVIFYPTDLHMPTLSVGGPETVRKLVMKVSVS